MGIVIYFIKGVKGKGLCQKVDNKKKRNMLSL